MTVTRRRKLCVSWHGLHWHHWKQSLFCISPALVPRNSGVPWTEWKERSRECYEDDLRFTDTPDHAGWINKCRKLYTTPPAPIALEAIENAIEYIRSIAFHIDEDDYHGKHIAYFMRQALVWLEGHSCSNDRQGKAENQPVRGNQTAESNRGNEWTGNPDIDNAIIMLDRIDTLESCDDDRIEAVKAVLRRLAGNYPDIPDSSVPVPERASPVNVSALSRMFIANWLTVSTIQRSSVLAPSNYEKELAVFWATLLHQIIINKPRKVTRKGVTLRRH